MAALAHFAHSGYHGATIRLIAADADVSIGLVHHHFGSKDGLRQACDAELVNQVHRIIATTNDAVEPTIEPVLRTLSSTLLGYLAHALVQDTPAARQVFDMLRATVIVPPSARRGGDQAAQPVPEDETARTLGQVLFADQVQRWTDR